MMMERILLGVLCLSGWVVFSSCLLHQYHFVADRMNWTEAQTYCREKYTDLATIENSQDLYQLRDTVSSAGHRSEVWIGLYGKNDWKWSNGYTGRGAEYRYWKDGHPYFYFNSDDFCVKMANKYPWEPCSCKIRYPFVCNNGTQQDPKFIFVSQPMNWSNAQRYCRENFRDMASVMNDTQNQELDNAVPWSPWAWIGLFRNPHSNWSDGSVYSVTGTNWYDESKPIGSTSVMCGVFMSGKFMFHSCETKFPFVCYSIPAVKRQVVKVKIRTDSSVDLNDPAVRADILRKYQDSLKEKGVSGVTLKWREQPDGKVFHKEGKRSEKKKREKTEL